MKDGLVPPHGKLLSCPAGWPASTSFVFGQAPLTVSILTLSSKVQPGSYNFLGHAAREVNQVWNFCNAATYKAWHGRYGGTRQWLSAFDLSPLLVGCGETFEKIGIDVAQAVAAEHAVRRSQFNKSKLRYRKSGGSHRSLGWIPFKPNGLRFSLHGTNGKRVTLPDDPQPVVPVWPVKLPKEDKQDYAVRKKAFSPERERAETALLAWENRRVKAAATIKLAFGGKTVRLFNGHRLLNAYRLAKQGVGALRSGNFAQDSLGDWYLNVVIDKVEAQLAPLLGEDASLGLDPGQITAMTGSDGRTLRSRRYRDMEPKHAQAQRRGHQKQAKRLSRQVKRQRQDDRNKFCRGVINDVARVWVGNLSPTKLKHSKLKGQAKSISDRAIGAVNATLKAMGARAGRVVAQVNEAYSTRRCSSCQSLTGPSGLDACVVRQWACAACGTSHDRDVNAAELQRQTGEWEWNTRPPGQHDRPAEPRYWLPCAGTR